MTASQDETVRLWDLCSGEDVGCLRGHHGVVKCLQMEDQMCVTGGVDTNVHIWDLRKVGSSEHDVTRREMVRQNSELIRDATVFDESLGDDGARIRTLEGHSQPVSSLFFEGNVLVWVLRFLRGASLTLRDVIFLN